MHVRNHYTPSKQDDFSLGTDFSDSPSLTDPSHAAELDIGRLVSRYDPDQLIELTRQAEQSAGYGDFTEVNEYQEALDIVRAAKDAFGRIPGKIRQRFEDPGTFFEWLTDPENEAEAIDLGLKAPLQASDDPPLSGGGKVPEPSLAAVSDDPAEVVSEPAPPKS